jgi:1,4-dihydroxy-2-naphthoate octaprenyltransferase
MKTRAPGFWTLWLTAVRPFAYTASVLPVLIGMAVAAAAGYPPRWGLFALTLLGVVSFHTTANLLNDAADFTRGLDAEVLPTSGAIVRGWLTVAQVARAARLFLAIGVLCGAVLVWKAGWVVLALGLAGGSLALMYTRTGFCLKYAGWGDPVIFVTFSMLPLFGTYWVQARAFSWLPFLWSVPAGSLAVAILHANNWRDLDRDRPAGCRTVAGRLGPDGSARYYRGLVMLPYAIVAGALLGRTVGGCFSGCPASTGLVFLSFPLALALARTGAEPVRLARLDSATARLHLLFGLLLVVGLLLRA